MKYGYARVSSKDQNLFLQKDALNRYGVDKIYEEKISSRVKSRPELGKLLSVLKEDDTIVIFKLDRISRSVKELISLSERFDKRGIHFISLHDSIDTTTANGRLFFRILASIAEFERDLISERTVAGLESARARGRLGGRPKVKRKIMEVAVKMYKSGHYTLRQVLDINDICKTTLYKYMKINDFDDYYSSKILC
jgi:DNA invertase Pin-like site-specific DNA recombinase